MLAAARKMKLERLPARMSLLLKVAPRNGARRRVRIPERTAAVGEPRGRVAVLLGCVQRVFYSQVHQATISALAAEGFEVLAPQAPDCCGALELHGGEEEAAFARARATIASFAGLDDVDHIVVNAAGCGSAMKEYGDLLGHAGGQGVLEPRVRRDRAARAARAPRAAGTRPAQSGLPRRVSSAARPGRSDRATRNAYADPGARAIGGGCRAGDLLRVGRDLQPGTARSRGRELGARKAKYLLETGADAIAAANPGCSAQLDMHLRELGRPLPIYHPVELVWRSIAAASASRVPG